MHAKRSRTASNRNGLLHGTPLSRAVRSCSGRYGRLPKAVSLLAFASCGLTVALSIMVPERTPALELRRSGVSPARGRRVTAGFLLASFALILTLGAGLWLLRRHPEHTLWIVLVQTGFLLCLGCMVLAFVWLQREIVRGRERELRLSELSAAWQQESERAEAANRLKSSFLAHMSHELRTPLNSILGFTGVLLQELPGPLNPEQRKQLGLVQASARHLLNLINDLLDLSKIEAGELKVGCLPYDLRELLERVVASVRPQAEAKGLALRVALSPEIGAATGDPRRVEQILLNLLSNAIKFTQEGEVVLSARLSDDGRAVVLQVRDTGIGISAEDRPVLFQPFQQLETRLARPAEGTGLGLAICKRLTELMGGEIHLDSQPGRGSTFTVVLPLHGKAPAPVASDGASTSPGP